MMLMVALLLAGALSQAPDDRAEAERLARAGAHADALHRFERLAADDPEDLDLRVWIARLHYWAGALDAAERDYRAVLAREAGHVDALVGLGSVLTVSGRLGEAARALNLAAELSRENAEVLAALGRLHLFTGETGLAVSYYRRALGLSGNDPDIRLGFERARRSHDHWVRAGFSGERFSGGLDGSAAADLSVNVRLTERLRGLARAQTQRKFAETDSRAGGGVEWRPTGRMTAQADVLAGPDATVLPRLDGHVGITYAAGRHDLTGAVRYARFADASVWILAPGITRWFNDALAVDVRYYASTTRFDATAQSVTNHGGLLRVLHGLRPRLWIEGGYARGSESFERFSSDQLGRFDADTALMGIRVAFPSLTWLFVTYEHQRRGSSVTVGRITTSLVQSF